MTASVFDSPLYARLFATGETGRLFSDTAALRAMLLVEGALAKAQGNLGMIPETSAAAIQRATLEIQIDPGALAASTGENGVCVPGLIAAFRKEMQAPEHAQYLHWGATSQDIIDTGLMLRLRQALALAETDLREVLAAFADMADRFADAADGRAHLWPAGHADQLGRGDRGLGRAACRCSGGAARLARGKPVGVPVRGDGHRVDLRRARP